MYFLLVKIVLLWKDIDMPPSQITELVFMAEEQDGLITARQAREAGFTDSAMTRLVQRGRLERTSRSVFRVPHLRPGRFSQYQEAVLWAKGNRGPAIVAISHATALNVYGVSDASPGSVHLTIPQTARLRRQKPNGIILHRADLAAEDMIVHEGIPLTSIARTVADLLQSGARIDIIRQAISGARKEGFIGTPEARRLRRRVEAHLKALRKDAGQTTA